MKTNALLHRVLVAPALFGCFALGASPAASAAIVRGQVLRAKGVPAPEIKVRVVSEDNQPSDFSFSSENGMYFLNNIPPGAYTVEIWATQDQVLRRPITVKEPLTDCPPIIIAASSGVKEAHLHVADVGRNLLEFQPAPVAAPPAPNAIDGEWSGTIPELNLPIVFHLNQEGTSVSDLPSRHAYGISVEAKISGDKATLAMASMNASFAGQSRGSQLIGTFTQNGQTFPLVLQKTGTKPAGGAVNLAGTWSGAPVGLTVPLVLHVTPDGNASIDSPTQGAVGIPARLSVAGKAVTLAVEYWGLTYSGTAAGNSITGTITQNGHTFPLSLQKQSN